MSGGFILMEKIVSTRQKRYYSYNPKDIAKELLNRNKISKNAYRQFVRGYSNTTAEKVKLYVEQFFRHAVQQQKARQSSMIQRVTAQTERGLFSVALTKRGIERMKTERVFLGIRRIDDDINTSGNQRVQAYHSELNDKVGMKLKR